jgi:hypothetical protein
VHPCAPQPCRPGAMCNPAPSAPQVRGKLTALIINDIDAGLGHFGNTQITVNNQVRAARRGAAWRGVGRPAWRPRPALPAANLRPACLPLRPARYGRGEAARAGSPPARAAWPRPGPLLSRSRRRPRARQRAAAAPLTGPFPLPPSLWRAPRLSWAR